MAFGFPPSRGFPGGQAPQVGGWMDGPVNALSGLLSGPAHALAGAMGAYVPPTAQANVLAGQQAPQVNALRQPQVPQVHQNSLLDNAMLATGVPAHARTFIQALAGRTAPITERDFTAPELQQMNSVIESARANRSQELAADDAAFAKLRPREIAGVQGNVDKLRALLQHVDVVPRGATRDQAIDALVKASGQSPEDVHWSVPYGPVDPMTVAANINDNLSSRLKILDKATGAASARFNGGSGTVQYEDYGERPRDNIVDTLGRFTYTTNPDGTRQVHDSYDFMNQSRRDAVASYKAMSPIERLGNVLFNGRDDPDLTSRVANAYIGDRSIPVNVKLPRR